MEIKDILDLIHAFDESSLSELRYGSGDQEVVLKRELTQPGAPVVAPGPSGAAPVSLIGRPPAAASPGVPNDGAPASSTVASEIAVPAAEGAGDLEQVVSPIVGTFYRSPSPDAPPFVEEGSEVETGGPLCILEAMKVMNEVTAEFDLEVVRVLAENGQMVEFGTPLLEVRRK
jgi:acetyl-CoA carboxylase biotin carboxyl carrier protein